MRRLTVEEPQDSKSELLRGAVIALLFVGVAAITIAVFALVRPWEHHVPTVVNAAPAQPPAHRSKGPGGRGSNDENDTTMPPGAPGASPLFAPPDAGTAAGALREALQEYRVDPRRTRTVTITTGGGVKLDSRGAPTALDGLPAESVHNGLVVTGGDAGGPAEGR